MISPVYIFGVKVTPDLECLLAGSRHTTKRVTFTLFFCSVIIARIQFLPAYVPSSKNLKPYTWCDEHTCSVIFCHVDTLCWASVLCMRNVRGPILWGVQRIYHKPILWGHNACMLLMHILRTNSYMHLCMVSSEGSMSSMKDQLYRISKCTE